MPECDMNYVSLFLNDFNRDQKGVVAIIFGLTAFVLLG